MNASRRALLAVGATASTAGCLFFNSSPPSVELYNNHDEPHYLHVRLTGSENEEPVHVATEYLRPDEDRDVVDDVDYDSMEGDFVVVTKIDHRDERHHDHSGGFAHLSIGITGENEINFVESVR